MIRLIADPTKELTWRNPLVQTIDHVFSDQECRDLIDRIERAGPEAAPISTATGAIMRPDVRNNDRVMLDDPATSELLFGRLGPHLPPVLEREWALAGLNERLRFYRYRLGQRFAPHFDGCFRRSDAEQSFLTVLVYLNTCAGGGATRLIDLDLEVAPAPGRCLLFNHHLLHEGAVVTSGEKYVVRSDVMYRRR